ncbi:hypothetical protein, partial [Falsigemmobacter intermedius]
MAEIVIEHKGSIEKAPPERSERSCEGGIVYRFTETDHFSDQRGEDSMHHASEVILIGYGERTFGEVLVGQIRLSGEWSAPSSGGFFFTPEGKDLPVVWAKSLEGFYDGILDWHADLTRNAS